MQISPARQGFDVHSSTSARKTKGKDMVRSHGILNWATLKCKIHSFFCFSLACFYLQYYTVILMFQFNGSLPTHDFRLAESLVPVVEQEQVTCPVVMLSSQRSWQPPLFSEHVVASFAIT